MLLSIGMIVKNEEKYLDECLRALQPLLDSVDSELIIADTGSTDNTVEIAKKYTDKVYYFEWINDFAAARNFTIEKSSGEWFMAVDADEVFQSVGEIIRFFNSGEYRKYNSATYFQRNYNDLSDRNRYNDFYAARLTKLTPDTRYTGIIHESFITIPPTKYLNAVVDHYGYAFITDPELSRAKYTRNLTLLKEKEKLEPDNITTNKQMADCYMMLKEYDKAMECVDSGIKKSLEAEDIWLITYLSLKASVYMAMILDEDSTISNHEDLKQGIIETVIFYFSENNIARKGILSTDKEMYAFAGWAYYKLNDYRNAITAYEQYFKLEKQYESGRLRTYEVMFSPMSFSNNKANYSMNVSNFLNSCMYEKRYNTCKEYLKLLPISDCFNNDTLMKKRLKIQLDLMIHTDFNDLSRVYSSLNEKYKQIFLRFLRWKILKIERNKELAEAMQKLRTGDPAFEDIVKIYILYINDEPFEEKAFEFISKYSSRYAVELLYMMLKKQYDISPYITAPDFSPVLIVEKLVTDFDNFYQVFAAYDISRMSSEGLENLAVLTRNIISDAIQRNKNAQTSFSAGKEINVDDLLKLYGSVGERWYNEIGSEAAHDAVKAAKTISKVNSLRQNGQYKECIEELRKLLKEQPAFSDIVQNYQRSLKADIDKLNAERNEMRQMKAMSAAVKENIVHMMERGNLTNAEKVLNELEQLCPDDAEIPVLRQKLDILIHQET